MRTRYEINKMRDALLSKHPDEYDELTPAEVDEIVEAMFSEYSKNFGDFERDKERFEVITKLLNMHFSIEYEAAGRVPWGWYYQAEELNRAANVLLDQIKRDLAFIVGTSQYLESKKENFEPGDDDVEDDLNYVTNNTLIPIYFFIAGTALENLLKALCILAEPSLVTETGCDPSLLKHKLRDYAHRSGLNFTSDEYQLLDRLTEYIVWHGRFPVHKKSSEYVKSKMREIVFWGHLIAYNDPAKYDQLYDRLSSDLWHALLDKTVSEIN